ncbi:glutamate racemase [Acinetobacter qingfengensis]|uniref:Glutamate racemase n=1 Tax=Acinetobacter qingfengensis TaxID=1262585 RepID=A0A1E7R1D9_9GAMM|nr:glutamate racemase [Acinetobacter qingfengensis]KAA8733343.1 glutamate racemase [Acinetobacter qingfengensis]OEY93142.1 glutamate racemase [Acinetobacter qingfengensis]
MTAFSQHNLAMPTPDINAPIGIFDSGIGGLSVALEVLKYLPNERILFYADTANVPYGSRGDAEIQQLTAQAIEWLYQQGCKIAIVACNTASAFSLDYLREHYGEKFPIIGLVPAVKPAVIQSITKVIAVLATPATFRGKLIRDVIDHFAVPAGIKVLPVTCLDLVPLIEQGKAMSAECLLILQQLLQPVMDAGADYLVLGCTHYPFLRPAIEQLYQDRLIMVDSGLAVARQSGRILAKQNLLTSTMMLGPRLICVFSGNNSQAMRPILQKMIGVRNDWKLIDLSNS